MLRSFRNADLIIETKDGATTKYVAVEHTAIHTPTDSGDATGPQETPNC